LVQESLLAKIASSKSSQKLKDHIFDD